MSGLRGLVAATLLFAPWIAIAENRASLVRPDPAGARNDQRPAHARRSRKVVVDSSVLDIATLKRGGRVRASRPIGISLFDDVWLPVLLTAVERHVNGAVAWTGSVETDPESSVVIVVRSDAVTAHISTRGHRYAIVPAANSHDAVEIDPASFEDEAEPLRVTSNGVVTSPLRTAVADSGETIDLLVAYTNVLKDALGGEAAMQSHVSSAVAATNLAFENSGVLPRVRLVGTAEVSYDDRLADSQTALTRLRGTTDGFMDNLHSLRNSLGADAVSLLVLRPTDGSVCGIGYLIDQPGALDAGNYAFNVVRNACAVGNLSFPHELGHNFGLEHDRANAAGSLPSQTYAYGYRDQIGNFRDIMSYNCTLGCPRLQYFSNPDIMVNGRPLGVNYLLPTAADNTRALNTNAPLMAEWRSEVSLNVTFSDDPIAAGVTPVRAIHLMELRNAIDALRLRAGLSATLWSSAVATGNVISVAHIMELRAALNPALTALGITPQYGEVVSSGSPVKASHIQELREYTK